MITEDGLVWDSDTHRYVYRTAANQRCLGCESLVITCLGCDAEIQPGDPYYCERCDLHAARAADLGQDNEDQSTIYN